MPGRDAEYIRTHAGLCVCVCVCIAIKNRVCARTRVLGDRFIIRVRVEIL